MAQIKIPEEFFIGTVADALNEILYALQGNQEVLIDLSEVSRIDTAAVQVVLSAKKEAECLGVTMTFKQSDIVSSFAKSIGTSL